MASKTLNLLKSKGILACLKYRFAKSKLGNLAFSLAFWRKIPIPQDFRFLFLTHHATGHNAMIRFLKKSNISFSVHFLENGAKRYTNELRLLSSYPDYPICMLSEWNFKDYEKYTSLLQPARVPALILVRDPISTCKSMVNFVHHRAGGYQVMGGGQKTLYAALRYLTSSDSLSSQYTYSPKPCLDYLEFIASDRKKDKMHSVFCLNEIIASFPNCTQKYFVDMGEISASRAFETMKDLSDKLGFEPPKEEEKEDYAQREYGDVYFLLPLSLNLDCGGDTITLVLNKWDFSQKHTDITENLVPSSYQNNVDLEKLRVYIKNQDLDKVSANLSFVQSEVKETLDTILDIVATRRANNLSEKDVLEYFKLNPQVARDFKAIFDEEYQILKQEKPELIESWKYYQEFERLCNAQYQN